MIDVFNQHVVPFFRLLEQARLTDRPLDMREATARLTMNIIGVSAFNTNLNALADDHASNELVQAFRRSTGDQSHIRFKHWESQLMLAFPFLKQWRPAYKEVDDACRLVRGRASELVSARLVETQAATIAKNEPVCMSLLVY